MATRFYLPSSGAAPVTAPAFPSGWTAGTTAPTERPTATTKSSGSIASIGVAETTASVTNIPVTLFISDPLNAQTISGTFTAVMRANESATAADMSLQVGLYVIANNGSSVLATLYAGHAAALTTTAGALGQEFGTTQSTRIMPSTAISSQSAAAGSRLMLIVGYRAHNTTTTSRIGTVRLGDPNVTDFALTAGLTTDLAPWVELSANITFQASAIDLVPANAAQAHTAANVALTQVHVLAPAPAAQAHTATNVALTQVHNLTVAKASQAHTAANVVVQLVAPPVNLTVQNTSHAHTVTAPTLTQVHVLTVAKASQAQTSTVPMLVQVHVLTVAKASQAQTASTVSLIQQHLLVLGKAVQAQTAGNVSLTQTHILAIQKASHSQTADNVTLSSAIALTVAKASQAQTAANVSLAQVHILSVQPASMAQAAQNVALAQLHQLAVDRAVHGHTAGGVVLGGVAPPVPPTYVTIRDRQTGPVTARAAKLRATARAPITEVD